MNTVDVIAQLGCHRGATAIAQEHEAASLTVRQVHTADPKPGRAREIAERYAVRQAEVIVHEQRCEEVAPRLAPEIPLVVAVDDLSSLRTVIETQRAHRILALGVARGPGERTMPAPTFGLALAAFPSRSTERAEATLLLSALERLSPPQSSQVIREDPLAAMGLERDRRDVSRLTVRRLAQLSRTEQEDDLLRLVWQSTAYPLVITRTTSSTVSRVAEQALDMGSRRLRCAVAVIRTDEPRVDFFVLEPYQRREGRFVRLWVPFTQQAVQQRIAAFTE